MLSVRTRWQRGNWTTDDISVGWMNIHIRFSQFGYRDEMTKVLMYCLSVQCMCAIFWHVSNFCLGKQARIPLREHKIKSVSPRAG